MIYIVNELCELEQDSYVNCHGAFTSEKEAYDKANEVYEQAVEDIGGEECYSEFKVWNDNNIITVEIHKVELKINENTKRDIAVNIIDSFEKVLQENDIVIPDTERKGKPEESNLFGETYYRLEDSIIDELNDL